MGWGGVCAYMHVCMHVCVKHITVSRVFDHMLCVCQQSVTVHAEFYLLIEPGVITSDETSRD